MRHEGVMQRTRAWLKDRPMAAWLVSVAFSSAMAGCILFVPGPHTPGIYFLLVNIVLGCPAVMLAQRMSPERQRIEPVSRHQKALIGMASCAAAAVGLLAFSAGLLHRVLRLGDTAVIALLMAFAFSALHALVFGSAARDTRLGRIGAALAVGGFLGISAAAFAAGLVGHLLHA